MEVTDVFKSLQDEVVISFKMLASLRETTEKRPGEGQTTDITHGAVQIGFNSFGLVLFFFFFSLFPLVVLPGGDLTIEFHFEFS